MRTFSLERQLWLPRTPEELFPFFADARNLGLITPDWLHFEILPKGEVAIARGTLIDYRIRIHGLPLRWRTEISEWNPPHLFVDQQLKGPYRLWHHTHRFEARDGGTLCTDSVRYAPIGGALVNALFVKSDVARIFDFRAQKLQELFPARSPLKT